MQSQFGGPNRPNTPFVNPAVDENYTLQGLNLRDPDSIITDGETYFTINSREYARNISEQRVANRMRQGASYLSTPVGETLNVENVATGNGDLAITNTTTYVESLPVVTINPIAFPFTPTSSGALTQLLLKLKTIGTATGHLLIEIYTDNAGVPGTLIGESSILGNTVTSTYADCPCRFIDAPSLISGTQYWVMAYVQDNGVGPYYIQETAGSGALSVQLTGNKTTGQTIVSTSALSVKVQFKTYLATEGGVQGFNLRYPSTDVNLILFAQLGSLYSVGISSATPTLIDATLSPTAPVRFAQVDDMTVYVDGTNPAKQWDGINAATALAGVPSTAPINVITWKNYLFFQTGNTRIDFSAINNFISYPSVNFFYIGTPLSADHMTGWVIFNDNLTIFTSKTKYTVLAGSAAAISTFTYKEAIGTRGAISQEAIVAANGLVYFISEDSNLYEWNGTKEVLLSDKLQPELSAIVDKSQIRLDFYRNQIRIYYPKSPSTFANQCLIFDTVLNQWFMDTAHPVAGSTNLYLDSQQLVEFSSIVGCVYYGENGFSDLGKAIAWKYWTNYKTYAYRKRNGQTFGGGSAKKRIKRFHPIVRTEDAEYTMYVGKDMDFNNTPDMREYIISGGGAMWGNFVWNDGTTWGQSGQVSNLSGMSGRGLHIQYRFERTGVETPAELYGYISQYKLGRQK